MPSALLSLAQEGMLTHRAAVWAHRASDFLHRGTARMPLTKCPIAEENSRDVRAHCLPPPPLPGAASNPRSAFNPVVLAYLGDSVWEAHARRIEVEADREAWRQARKGKQNSNPRDQVAARNANPGLGEQQQGDGGGDQNPSVSQPYTPTWEERKLWATARYQAFVYDTLVSSSSGRASKSGEDASAKTIGPASAGAAPASCAPTASGADGAAGGGHQLVPLALSGQEQDVLRWGRNAAVNIPRHLPAMVYKKATAVEVLVAYLYLTAPSRCAALVAAAVQLRPPEELRAAAAAEAGRAGT